MNRTGPWLRALSGRFRAALTDAPFPGAGGTPGAAARLGGMILYPPRLVAALAGDIVEGQLTLRAMSLVYTTLLSLVPLLAIGFSVLKGFGVHNQVEPMLLGLLEPLGEQGVEITETIIGFVDNVQVGVLGFVGLLLLFYTVVSLLEKVERAFNHIWHVPSERPLSQKMRDYLALVVLGPVAVILALGATSSLLATAFIRDVATFGPAGEVLALVGQLAPLLVISITFTFLYMFIPNTRVRFLPALAGGLAAGLTWMVIGWGFASFMAGSVRYAAIYSAFAALILFMIWLYVVWLIVLLGCSVTFYAQNPLYIGISREATKPGIAARESAALTVIWHILRGWYRGEDPLTPGSLAERTGIALPLVQAVLAQMVETGLLERGGSGREACLPARPPETVTIAALRQAIRGCGSDAEGERLPRLSLAASPDGVPPAALFAAPEHRPVWQRPRPSMPAPPEPVAALMARMDRAVDADLEGMTLKDLAALPEPEAAMTAPGAASASTSGHEPIAHGPPLA